MSDADSFVRLALIVIAVVFLLPLLLMVVMMPVMGMWGWGHMWSGGLVSGAWFGVWFVFLLLLVTIGYLLYRAIGSTDDRGDGALEELRLAYARGDLSDEEFEARRERLEPAE